MIRIASFALLLTLTAHASSPSLGMQSFACVSETPITTEAGEFDVEAFTTVSDADDEPWRSISVTLRKSGSAEAETEIAFPPAETSLKSDSDEIRVTAHQLNLFYPHPLRLSIDLTQEKEWTAGRRLAKSLGTTFTVTGAFAATIRIADGGAYDGSTDLVCGRIDRAASGFHGRN
jgi:hypothetical protein